MKAPAVLLGQIEYLDRHYRTLIRHLTPRKIANILMNELELRFAKTTLRSRPFFIKVEPTPLCHLSCPGCEFNGPDPRTPMPKGSFMSCQDFINIIKPVEHLLVGLSLSLRGDSLLNPEVFDMLAYCRDHNIGTVFPTHFSYPTHRGQAERLVECGLDHLMVSLDGITQASYERYRKGGKIDLVLQNCQELIEIKRRKKSSLPYLEWKFTVFDHNKHEVDEARALSKKMGFDKFSLVVDNTSLDMDSARGAKNACIPKGTACYWLYRTMVVCWDGQALACCIQDFNLGNVKTDGFLSVWNGPEYRALREMFTTGKATTKNGRICMRCEQAWMSQASSSKRDTAIAQSVPWPENASHFEEESLPFDSNVPWFDRNDSREDNGQRVFEVSVGPKERIQFNLRSEGSNVIMRIHAFDSPPPLEWRMALMSLNYSERSVRAKQLGVRNPTSETQKCLLILYGLSGHSYRVDTERRI